MRERRSSTPAAKSKRVKPKRVPQRELEEVREKDPDGRIVVHHRTVDTLGKMLKAGTITPEMHDAAKDFQAAFIVASLDPLRALPILRVPGTGRDPELNERQLHARDRVYAALEALGGISSPAGSCMWHVVGLQRSVREWAIRRGWGGRPVRQEQAQGILVAALGILAAHTSRGENKQRHRGGDEFRNGARAIVRPGPLRAHEAASAGDAVEAGWWRPTTTRTAAPFSQ